MRSLKILQYFVVYILVTQNVDSKITEEEYNMMPKVFHLDDFDNCMNYGKNALYCNTVLQLGPIDVQNKSRIWNIIQEVIRNPRYYRHDRLRYGVCVPDSCPGIKQNSTDEEALKNGIADCYTSKLEHLGLKAIVRNLHCETDEEFYPIDNYDIGVAIALMILVSVVLFASYYEGRARYKSKEEYQRIISTKTGRTLACFSIPKNWDRLKSKNLNPDVEDLKALSGIRFYNLLLVILVHAALCTLATSIRNPTFAENFTLSPENMILANGLGGIQTFMLVAGFLIAYNFSLIVKKQKNFKIHLIALAFVNRYIRLTPCLMVMIALNATWIYHLGRGPQWDKALGMEYRNCRNNWWANLLYINNYYDVEHMCLIHAWYLATDTQLFLVSLIVVALVWKYERFAKLILGLAVTIGFALPGIINYYYNYDIIIRMYPEGLYTIFSDVPQWHHMYSSALVNFGGYALGMTFGYTFYKRGKNRIFTKKIYVAVWWIVIWALPLLAIFYAYFIYQEDFTYTRIGAAIYVSVYRLMVAGGIGCIIYGTSEGIGWMMRNALVWQPIQVLGRLTYCTYLVHVAVIRVRGAHARSSSYLSYYTMLTQTSGDALISFALGTILTLFVEMPVSALQKLMFPKLANKKTANSIEDQADAVETGYDKNYDQRF